MRIRLFLLPPLIMISSFSQGQRNDIYPDLYSAFFNNVTLINPSYVSKEGKAELIATYKNRIGPFSKIATYSFTGGRIFRKDNGSAHVARLFFFNEKDGPYIHRPRAYANYAYSLSLSENTSFSAGAAIGFTQVSFSAPSATGVGSATFPDGSIGLMLSGKHLTIGISSMQILNRQSEAINALIRLRRHYNLFLSAEKELGPYWSVKGYFLYRMLPNTFDNADAALSLDYKHIFSFGSSARYKQGLSFFMTVNVNIGKDRLLINFAYNSPIFSKNNSLLNSLEATSGYFIN